MAACPICRHPERVKIEEALLTGQPYRPLVERYGVSLGLVSKHRRLHLAEKLAKAIEARAVPAPEPQHEEAASTAAVERHVRREALSAEGLLDRVLGLSRQAEEILAEARAAKQPGLALSAIGKAGEMLKLMGGTLALLREQGGCARCRGALPADLPAAIAELFEAKLADALADAAIVQAARPSETTALSNVRLIRPPAKSEESPEERQP